MYLFDTGVVVQRINHSDLGHGEANTGAGQPTGECRASVSHGRLLHGTISGPSLPRPQTQPQRQAHLGHRRAMLKHRD